MQRTDSSPRTRHFLSEIRDVSRVGEQMSPLSNGCFTLVCFNVTIFLVIVPWKNVFERDVWPEGFMSIKYF